MAPLVTIDSGPQKQTKKRKAKFIFSSDDPTATFECRIDKSSFAACTSPAVFKKLKRAKHVFEVRAADANGNSSSTASQRWKVKKKKKKR